MQLFWITFHTLTIWLAASPIPTAAGFRGLGLPFGSREEETVLAGWMAVTAVGFAVALPSVPGFFGWYHSACRLVLERFGMSPEIAVASGTLLRAVLWLTSTALGFAVLRLRRTRLEALDRAARGEVRR